MELSKIPHLLKHYFNDVEHEGESFSEFLSDHYGENNHHNDEHKGKGCLPFQDDCSCITPVYINSTPVIFTHEGEVYFTKTNTLYIEPSTSAITFNIWNPPKKG